MKAALSLLFLLPVFFLLRCTPAQWGILLLSLLIHEGGHIAAGQLLGYPPKRLLFSPAGLTLDMESALMPYKKEVLLHLAGPIANLLFLLPALLLIRRAMTSLRLFLFFSNFLLAAVNLLPIGGLDGGRALYALLCMYLLPERASAVLRITGGISLLFLSALSLYVLAVFHNPSLGILCLSLFFEELGFLKKENKKRETKHLRLS